MFCQIDKPTASQALGLCGLRNIIFCVYSMIIGNKNNFISKKNALDNTLLDLMSAPLSLLWVPYGCGHVRLRPDSGHSDDLLMDIGHVVKGLQLYNGPFLVLG